ncbi:MAG: hypothetical protein ABI156_00600 [Caldimonas sp.]
MREKIIEHALGYGAAAGAGADAGSVAVAAVRALRLLLAELEPLVGSQAVRALYTRSLHLTRARFGWPAAEAAESLAEALTGLQQNLGARVPADARRAGATLLNTFADLLVSLIGDPLTQRLLRSAWGSPSADKSSEEKSQ